MLEWDSQAEAVRICYKDNLWRSKIIQIVVVHPSPHGDSYGKLRPLKRPNFEWVCGSWTIPWSITAGCTAALLGAHDCHQQQFKKLILPYKAVTKGEDLCMAPIVQHAVRCPVQCAWKANCAFWNKILTMLCHLCTLEMCIRPHPTRGGSTRHCLQSFDEFDEIDWRSCWKRGALNWDTGKWVPPQLQRDIPSTTGPGFTNGTPLGTKLTKLNLYNEEHLLTGHPLCSIRLSHSLLNQSQSPSLAFGNPLIHQVPLR